MAKEKSASILNPQQRAVLEVIAEEAYFTERFYLAGGTALAEFYLQHRISEDLDFFSEHQEVNSIHITRFFQTHKKTLRIERVETSRVLGLQTFFLHFRDGIFLKVDFNYYPFPLIEKGVIFNGLKVESVHDIGVDKLHTVVLKPRARDFIDLYFIVREKGYDFRALLIEAKAKFDWDLSSVELGTRLLEAAEMIDYPRMLKEIDHNEWKQFFIGEARKLKKEIFE